MNICILHIVIVLCTGITDGRLLCSNGNNSLAIEDGKVCDGINDCLDDVASDECNCNNTLRDVCKSGKCIVESNVCDGVDDCKDGSNSDEKNCSPLPPARIRLERKQTNCDLEIAIPCADGQTCVLPGQFCDGKYDCPDQSDEIYSGPGLKCVLRSSFTTACVLPQEVIYSDRSVCVNRDDLCFDENGNLTSACFQCMDGNHIISKFQVCDGVLDCMDFSDECLCGGVNNTPAVCTLYADNHLSCNSTTYPDSSHEIKNKWINGTISCGDGSCVSTALICNGVEDCSSGVDEENCISPLADRSMTALVHAMYPLDNRVPGVFDIKQFQNVSVQCLNNMSIEILAKLCDDEAYCYDLLDECHSSCENPPPYCNIKDPCLHGGIVCNGRWQSDHLCLNGRVEEEEMGCPNRFYCKRGNKISIRMEQVCDGIVHCEDGSDETQAQNCTDGRFYCETFEGKISVENPLFVSRSVLHDGRQDCADGSDECPSFNNKDMFSYRNEMIASFALRIVLWFIGPMAFLGNIAVLATTIHTMRTTKLNTIGTIHRYMILNLSVADGLMGVYLMILTVASVVNSGSFCLSGRTWRASILCKVMGTIVIISSQASVFILLLMGFFRLYTILRPFEAQFSKNSCGFIYKSIFVSWVLAISLAVIPWCFDYFITDYHYTSLFFPTDQVDKSDYQTFVAKVTTISQSNNIKNSTIIIQRNFSENGNTSWKTFTSNIKPYIEHSGSFGFYSQNSICLPSYFTRSDHAGWQYSIAIVTINFTIFILMAFVYVEIAYYGNPERHPALKNLYVRSNGPSPQNASSRQFAQNGKLNFQKCRLHGRVARLILTDFLCWIPLCILSYSYFSGVNYDKSVIAVCGIVLLPLNSALNPILYSGLFESALQKTKRFCCKNKLLRSISKSTQRFKLNSSNHQETPRKSPNTPCDGSMLPDGSHHHPVS